MPRFRKSSPSTHEFYKEHHRYEHWYRDKTVYFITARCREKFPAFETQQAWAIFWDRFNHYTAEYGFTPFVTSLMLNHYHTEGYLRIGANLGPMMQRIHGSVAKLVNDLLPTRLLPFWRDKPDKDYFDGCIRDELQCRRAYRYTLTQCKRHGICADYRSYPDTRIGIDVDVAVKRALELNAFMEGVPYKRYQRDRKRSE